MVLIWKQVLSLTYILHFLVTKEKTQKFLQYISHLHTRILLTLLTFLPSQFWKKMQIYHVWFLFDATPGVNSYSRHFEAINK